MKKIAFIFVFIFLSYSGISQVMTQNTYPWPQTGKVGLGKSAPTSQLDIESDISGQIFGGAQIVPLRVTGLRSQQIMSETEDANIFEIYAGNFGGLTGPVLTVHSHMINFEVPLDFTTAYINDYKLYLRGKTDHNHFLGFHSSFAGKGMDGPVLAGYGSGMLGTTQNGDNFSLFWNKDGKVGIGTINLVGDHKLYVAGSMIAEEIVVKLQGNWPDYVFDENFELRSLANLEAYIEEENHLPDVPSAEEISENGVEVGEMNAILLKKIEELTLYVIELNKEIKELKNK